MTKSLRCFCESQTFSLSKILLVCQDIITQPPSSPLPLTKSRIWWWTEVSFSGDLKILQELQSLLHEHRNWCNIPICHYFPAQIIGVHKWNIHLFMLLEVAMYINRTILHNPVSIQEWGKCLHLHVCGGMLHFVKLYLIFGSVKNQTKSCKTVSIYFIILKLKLPKADFQLFSHSQCSPWTIMTIFSSKIYM